MNLEQDAMGADEYHPISHRGSNFSTHGGIGYTVIDAIDTMYLMGLEDEYKRARHWIATKHTFDRDGNFNTFEACITLFWSRIVLKFSEIVDNHPCPRRPFVDIPLDQRSIIPRQSHRPFQPHASYLRYTLRTPLVHDEPWPAARCR